MGKDGPLAAFDRPSATAVMEVSGTKAGAFWTDKGAGTVNASKFLGLGAVMA